MAVKIPNEYSHPEEFVPEMPTMETEESSKTPPQPATTLYDGEPIPVRGYRPEEIR